MVREFNRLRVTLQNEGFGVAREIRVVVRGDYEGDLERKHRRLAPRQQAMLEFRLAPHKAGDATPLDIEVSYQDEAGNTTQRTVESSVPVLAVWRAREQRPQVVIINAKQYVAPGAQTTNIEGSVLVRSSVGGGPGVPATPAPGIPAGDVTDTLVAGGRRLIAPADTSKEQGRACPMCGVALKPGEAQCPSCHARLCPHCLNALPEGTTARHCPTCGQPIQG